MVEMHIREVFLKFSFVFVIFGSHQLVSCKASYDVPELPDLNKKTFSDDDVENKKKDLLKKVQKNKNAIGCDQQKYSLITKSHS